MRNVLKTWFDTENEKKVLLLRHGDIGAEPDKKRFIGQTDPPLSDRGRHQAQYWCGCLSDTPPACIVSSDLSRCMETARIIAENRSMEVKPQAELREIFLGKWEGMTFSQVKQRWPGDFFKRGKDMAGFRPPAGENFLDLQQRVIPAFNKAVDQAGERILIVAHAGVNRIILCHLLGMPVENLFRIAQGSGAMNLIDRQTGGYRVASLNLLPDPDRVEPCAR